MAVWKPVPGSPMIRSPGIQQLSKRISRVGDPWMPSLRSGVPSEKPSSSRVDDERRDPAARTRLRDR